MLAAILGYSLERQYLVLPGGDGVGKGKTIVFLAGDEEYRSEEGLPMLARILSKRYGFRCVVSFSINPKGEIDPTVRNHQPGIGELDRADLCVMALRFREWPNHQMAHFVRYFEEGKPFIGLRTSTHAFDYAADSPSPYRRFDWQSREWPGGFGRQVLGESWVAHWGEHGKQATRAIHAPQDKWFPILNGVSEVFADSDVYEAHPPADATILMLGQVLDGYQPKSAPLKGPKNEPMMPVAWMRRYSETGRSFTTTMGAATDLLDENLRRLIVNAAHDLLGLEIPKKANVDVVGEYRPRPFGFGGFQRGVRP